MIRFRFTLRPLQDVTPWGGDNSTLHWFGLTDGWYWIEAGDHELLRYSDRTLRRWAAEDGDDSGSDDDSESNPHVDYYAARFWEDVLEMVSVLTETVPADLADFVAAELPVWLPEDATPQAEAAADWHSSHSMYTGPLVNAPHVRLWRTIVDGDDVVTVAWKNGSDSDIEFAAPIAGRIVVPKSSFDAAVSELDRELLAAMEERVTALETTGPPPGVHVELGHLRREHRDRATWLARARARQVGTDWAVVRAGAQELRADQDAL